MAEPYCLAMVLCDAVHRDPATAKHFVMGTFSSVGATDFRPRFSCPFILPSPTD